MGSAEGLRPSAKKKNKRGKVFPSPSLVASSASTPRHSGPPDLRRRGERADAERAVNLGGEVNRPALQHHPRYLDLADVLRRVSGHQHEVRQLAPCDGAALNRPSPT